MILHHRSSPWGIAPLGIGLLWGELLTFPFLRFPFLSVVLVTSVVHGLSVDPVSGNVPEP